MVKKVLIVLICFFSFIFSVGAVEFDLNSQNAVLYNLDEDKILYELNGDEEIAIASMTKIMSAIVTLENIESLDQKVIMQSSDFIGLTEAGASVAGFKAGEVLTYRDLLYGLLLPSGADAAQALTRTVAGSRAKFVEMMNEKAQELGMKHTHFANETGLDVDGAYSTVKDVAIMFKYALEKEDFKTIISSDSYKISDGLIVLKSTTKNFINTYNLDMDYFIGGKTGTTKKAGRCLASIATYNGTNYMLITARAPMKGRPYNMDDAKKIYEYFMNHYRIQKVLNTNDLILSLKTSNAKPDIVNFYAPVDVEKYLPNDFMKSSLVYDYDGIDVITPDMKSGDKLGILNIYYNDEIISTIDIVLEENLEFDYLEYISNHKIEITIGATFLLILIFIILIIKKRKKKRRKKVKKI